jgi:hypothetical protein
VIESPREKREERAAAKAIVDEVAKDIVGAQVETEIAEGIPSEVLAGLAAGTDVDTVVGPAPPLRSGRNSDPSIARSGCGSPTTGPGGARRCTSFVARLTPRRPKPPSQTWRTFLENHLADLFSVDFSSYRPQSFSTT